MIFLIIPCPPTKFPFTTYVYVTNNENQAITTQQLCDNIRELIQETNQPVRKREARRIKGTIENIWYKKLNDRRKQFWQKLRNENQANIYEQWRNQTPIIIPASILYKSIAVRYRPVSYPDGPITDRYSFINIYLNNCKCTT